MNLTDAVFSKRAALVPGMSADQERRLDELRQTFVDIELKAKQLGIDIASSVAPELETMAKWTAKILEDLIQIVGYVLKLAPVKNILNIGGASLNTVGDLLDVVAGKGLNVEDIYKQSARMGAGVAELHREFGAFVPEAATGLFAGGGKTVTIHQNPTYNIHGANDPHRVAAAIREHHEDMQDVADQQINQVGHGH
jgi:hypothetical protein